MGAILSATKAMGANQEGLDRADTPEGGQDMAMTAIALEANLIQLDTFLKSGDAPLECMTLSDLDGFLTGIAVGPEPIPPREWLPVVWGEEAPTFVNEAQARVVLDAIMGRYNEILREIDEGAPQPILWRASDGATIASDWAKGFAKAMALRLGLWDQLARSKVAYCWLQSCFCPSMARSRPRQVSTCRPKKNHRRWRKGLTPSPSPSGPYTNTGARRIRKSPSSPPI